MAVDSNISFEAKNLSCIRDDRLLFENLSFSLFPSEVLVIEGRNGSGKTSLLRILCGFRLQDDGDIEWCGRSITHSSSMYSEELTYVGHKNGIKDDLTVEENLKMGRALGIASDLTDAQVLQRVGLSGFEDVQALNLSAGQRRRLSLARLLLTTSRVWILDEPFTSLDTHGISVFEEMMQEHVNRQGMLIMTSHHPVHLPEANIKRINLTP